MVYYYLRNHGSVFFIYRDNLRQLIAKRVGQESFVEKLEAVSKHELYTLAAQKPQLRFSSSDTMMFDYEFTSLYKQLESKS